jgi:hypothetical protein
MAEDLTQLKTWLSAALTAQHNLALGLTAQEVHVDGQRVVYNATSLDKLRAYIADLRARIIKAGGTCDDGGARRVSGGVFVGGGGSMPNGFN